MTRLAAALVALLVAGCAAGTGPTPEPATPAVTAAPVTPSPASSSAEPSAAPSSSPVANTTFTAADEEIAKLVEAGAEEAVPELRVLNDSDPSKLEDLFLPLGDWITAQRAAVQALTPSSCTTAAVELYEDGLAQYDAIRKKFLAWRDWGATGHAFPPGAPREAATAFEDAVAELHAHCPT
jgi:hypothetical protein